MTIALIVALAVAIEVILYQRRVTHDDRERRRMDRARRRMWGARHDDIGQP